MSKSFEDAFNLLCGDRLGGGIHREVFECRLRPELVVKVERDAEWRYFANQQEMHFWDNQQFYKPVADWLAPCHFLSPDGRILLQERARICSRFEQLPDKIPGFLTDRKPQNFGYIGKRFVCVDYAMTLDNPNIRLSAAKWRTGETEFAGIKKT